jgi:drug/metabolite transporter (DMT)-like permease
MRGAAAMTAAAFLMSTVSVFVRNIEADALNITFLRLSTALVFVSVFVFATGQMPRVKDRSVVILAVFNVLTVFSYITAIRELEVATAALLLYMAPIYVLLFAWISGEKINRKTFIALPSGLLGLYLMLTPYPELDTGIFFGIISGLSYALVFYFAKKARMRHSSFEVTFFNLAFSTLILLPYFIVNPPINAEIKWVVGLGLIPTAIPFFLFNYGIKYLKVQMAPIIALVEPLSAAIIGYIVFGEILSLYQIIGAAMILTSVAIAWSESN